MAGPLDLRGTVTITDRGSATLRRLQGRIAAFSRRSGLTQIAQQGRQVARSMGTATAALGRLVVPLAGLGSLASVAGLAGIGVAINSFANEADTLAKFSRQVGFTAQSLRELNFIADRQGVNQSVLSSSLVALTKRMGELKVETGGLYTFLNRSNPALLEQLKTVESMEEAFGIVLGSMSEMENASDRNALAAAAFSRSGIAMGNIAELGAEGIAKLRTELVYLAGSLPDSAFSDAEIFKDSMTNLGTALTGLRDAVGKDLLPLLTPLIDSLKEWVVANRELIATKVVGMIRGFARVLRDFDWAGAFRDIRDGARAFMDFMEPLGGLKTVAIVFAAVLAGPLIGAIVSATIALGGLAAAILTTPIGWAAVVIGGAAALIKKDWEDFAPFFDDLFSNLGDIARGLGLDDILKGQFSLNVTELMSGFAGVGAALENILSQIGVSFYNWFAETFGADLAARLANAFNGMALAWGSALEDVKQELLSWVEWFKSTFVQPILNLINSIKAGFAAIGSGLTKDLSGVGVTLGSDGNVDGLASGGPVRRGVPYIVGERRPELFVPNQNGRILPRVPGGLLAGAAGGGAGTGQRTRATLDINLRGAPDGTSVRYAESGEDLFDRPRVNVGRTMAPSRALA